jgi:hypothetical protein
LKGRTVQIFGNNPKNQNPFRKKLRADWSRGMLVIIRCRSSVLQFVIQKYKE